MLETFTMAVVVLRYSVILRINIDAPVIMYIISSFPEVTKLL